MPQVLLVSSAFEASTDAQFLALVVPAMLYLHQEVFFQFQPKTAQATQYLPKVMHHQVFGHTTLMF